ncbi:peptide chain release factor N(5)-glutamine methyltransferase [Microbacterium maritypicum]|uniref:Release factor glutamine methyltransferase n=2 Tax=Microbacterium maritypicum TaxID=33918 RepID=A0AAJ5SLZ5_MICMQ|nr:peptide chain release factor N(5)-glutamine methyltransferase [Microbacterium liquefaciens]MBP5801772.1 peptide chain release factor N(5)-glutamine methyltransferase [Microbacterium liquefaciens]UTT51577.1 peptide chain release factor N(5)-glutamine methyltransferase [Microbacterium liquefaciens]WEF19642.1 peptide chain release factor N(5)-glutamine methyltransferase [Microbacterium liquefaciens]
MSDTSLAAVVRTAAQRLADVGVPDPLVDAELLAGHILGRRRGEVQAAIVRGDGIDDAAVSALDEAVTRRAAREPLQHITGTAPFRHLELAVGPGVFVPRPETETVVQYAIDALLSSPESAPVGIDLGTGSGAIALAMATEVPHARIFAAELSEDAHAWASRNVAGVENLTLVLSDLGEAFPELDGTASVVISNPPYVPDAAIPRDPEVRLFDPAMALYGGEDGLDIVRVLSSRALRLLRPGGLLVIEHGELQGESIRDLLTADGWRAPATHRDLTLRDRTTTALRP